MGQPKEQEPDPSFTQFDFFPKSTDSISMPPPSPVAMTETSSHDTLSVEKHPPSTADMTWTPEEERKLVRKIDIYLLPTIWLMALMSWMDRSNIGNAAIAGMDHDLALTSSQYSMVIIIFYFGYVTWGPISNLLLPYFRPSLYLPTLMFLWGVLTLAMAAVKSYPHLLLLRLFIGIMEAGLSPGVIFIVSCWYRPEEQAKRVAAALSAALLGGAFGGLIAGTVSSALEGTRGIRGWRWLFIVEGGVTVLWAVASGFLLPDFPGNWKRFDEREKVVGVGRIRKAGVVGFGEGRKIGRWEAVGGALRDWRVWLITFGVGLLGCSTVLAYFYPILIRDMGYSSTRSAQLLTIPIWGAAVVCALASGVIADRFPRHRALMMAGWMGMSTVTTIVVCLVYNSVARYVLLVVMAGGVWAAVALNIALVATTFSDMEPEVRAFAVSLPGCAGNFGNVYGAYLFPKESGPRFLLGFGVVTATLGGGALLFVAVHFLLQRRRRAKEIRG